MVGAAILLVVGIAGSGTYRNHDGYKGYRPYTAQKGKRLLHENILGDAWMRAIYFCTKIGKIHR